MTSTTTVGKVIHVGGTDPPRMETEMYQDTYPGREGAPSRNELDREAHEMRATVAEDGRTCLFCLQDTIDCECED